MEAIILLIVAGIASLFAAFTIGASSSGATPFAPAVGANAITTMQAGFFVGILGALGAIFQGAAVAGTIGEDLIVGPSLSPVAATLALTIAAVYIGAGVFAGYPIATAFAITGSVVGVGLAMGGAPAWGEYRTIGLYWLLTPVMVTPPAYLTTKLLMEERYGNRFVIPGLVMMVMVVIAHMRFLLLGEAGEESTIAAEGATLLPVDELVGMVIVTAVLALVPGVISYRAYTNQPVITRRKFLLALGGLVAFTAGAGKVGLAVGPLIPLVEEIQGSVPMTPILTFGSIGILLGSWMLATRVIKALAQDYASLGPDRSIGVLIPSFLIAQLGVFFGIPMSFNEIFISAIAGAGIAAGEGGVSRDKILNTTYIWIGSIIFSLVVGYAGFWAVDMVLSAL